MILIIAGMLLTTRRHPDHPAARAAERAPSAWLVGITSVVASSLVVIAPHLPAAVLRTLTVLLVEAAAVVAITVWSRRAGWGDSQILALAADKSKLAHQG